MNEKQAWQSFFATGRIEDYIKYTQIRDQALKSGAVSMEEIHGAGENTGFDNKRTGGGGERPFGDGAHP